MKRSTASWTTALAASALLAMPVGSWAQQPSPTPSQTTSRPSGTQMDQQGSANEHLRQAAAALNDIPASSLTDTTKTKVAELKSHIATLSRSASSTPASGKAATELAAADRILTELLGSQSTTGATEPGAAGTTGSTSTKPGARSKSSASTAATLDESARAKLQEARTHLTAFAASISDKGSAPGATTTSTDDPSSPASASAASTSPASTSAAASPSSAPAASSPSAAQSSPSAASPSTTPPSEPPAAAAPAAQEQSAPAANSAQSVDAEIVKRHLTAARDSLSQLTQLPAAAQLTGDARTQVSQLISNFNDLITTNSNWRASYDKVQANVTALVGDQKADESPAPATGTAGAVGTSGTTALDPAIRAKLVEFRTHLMEFEKAAGGGSSTASPSSSSASAPAASPESAAAAESAPAASTATTSATASAQTTSPAPAATPDPAPTGTSGSTASTPSAAGTSGRSSPTPASSGGAATAEPQERQSSPAKADAHQESHGKSSSEAMRHIEAIEAILNGSATAGTTGSADSKSSKTSVTSLDRAQIEQIRTHLAALRRALNDNK